MVMRNIGGIRSIRYPEAVALEELAFRVAMRCAMVSFHDFNHVKEQGL